MYAYIGFEYMAQLYVYACFEYVNTCKKLVYTYVPKTLAQKQQEKKQSRKLKQRIYQPNML